MKIPNSLLYSVAGTLTALLLDKSPYRQIAGDLTPHVAATAWPIILPAILVLRIMDVHKNLPKP